MRAGHRTRPTPPLLRGQQETGLFEPEYTNVYGIPFQFIVDFRPRLTGFTDHTARLADGTAAAVDAVVWATGYRSDYSWLHVPGVIVEGQVRHEGGASDVAGLYFLGLPWQANRGSGLLGFIARDAASLADRLHTAQDEWQHPATGSLAGAR